MSWYPNPAGVTPECGNGWRCQLARKLRGETSGPKMDQHLERTLWLDTCRWIEASLGGGFKHVLFSSLPGEMIQFDWYFSNGLKPPTSSMCVLGVFCLFWLEVLMFFILFFFTMFVGHWIFGSKSCCSLYEYWKILEQQQQEQHPYKHFWCDFAHGKWLCNSSGGPWCWFWHLESSFVRRQSTCPLKNELYGCFQK